MAGAALALAEGALEVDAMGADDSASRASRDRSDRGCEKHPAITRRIRKIAIAASQPRGLREEVAEGEAVKGDSLDGV